MPGKALALEFWGVAFFLSLALKMPWPERLCAVIRKGRRDERESGGGKNVKTQRERGRDEQRPADCCGKAPSRPGSLDGHAFTSLLCPMAELVTASDC